MPPIQKPFGLWSSPLSPRSLAAGTRLSDAQWDSDGATVVWHEGRSDRGLLVAGGADGAPRDLTDPALSVRGRVGYGGGEFTVGQGHAYFAGPDGRLLRQALQHGPARPITPAFGAAASPTLSPDGRWLLYVHTYEQTDHLAVVASDGSSWPQILVGGDDFYMQPAWHPSGTMVAYIAWSHPQMPWDGTRLVVVPTSDPSAEAPRAGAARTLAGDERTSVQQPCFSPDGRYLAYISDASGWSQIYLYDLEKKTHRQLSDGAFEVGRPAWVQGIRTIAWSHTGRALYAIHNTAGFATLWRHDLEGEAQQIAGLEAYTWLEQLAASPTRDAVALIASSSTRPPRVISLDLTTSNVRVHRRSGDEQIAEADLARPQPLSWPSADGTTAHGLYYPPASSRFVGEGAPPTIIRIHGGPTSQATAAWDAGTQFFATRGYAVLQLNHRGSTGYGRAYMEQLNANWGVVDTEDVGSGARYLIDAGLADAKRLIVMGGSAGGFTVLNALIHHPGLFRAGLCLYGVANLLTLAADTHKFEARYLDSIVGPLPAAVEVYRARSPINAADKLVDPLAVFQGSDDTVVPPSQSEAIVASLKARGVPHEYHLYEGEGHGWRKSDTIAAFWGAVERFLRSYVIFA
jgi:dipeptidyl aminopeptidase/acylaminoacyl peptidase